MKKFTAPLSTLQCPQCGYELPLYFKYTKLIKCTSCKSSIFLEDGTSANIGESSALTQEPSLIEIGISFEYDGVSYLPVGMVRYSYGRGFWEEWWLKDSKGNGWWLSVDEGDMVLEQPISNPYGNVENLTLSLGAKLGDWFVSEMGTGVCEGFEGSLPKEIAIGSQYRYIHLSSHGSKLRTIELHSKGVEVYEGEWIDTFGIRTQER